jgi:hypothetical protein
MLNNRFVKRDVQSQIQKTHCSQSLIYDIFFFAVNRLLDTIQPQIEFGELSIKFFQRPGSSTAQA